MAGYDTKLFVEKPDENFICALCLNVINEPRQCPNGHMSCFQCIKDALNRREECPTCKIKLTVDSLSRSLFVQNSIHKLKTFCISRVECPTLSSGHQQCQWTGNIAER